MLYKNIMVAFDGSEHSVEALVVAKDLINQDKDATLHIVTVVPIGSLGLSSSYDHIGLQQIFPDTSAYDEALQGAKDYAIQGIDEALEDLLDDADFKITKEAIVAAKAAEGICKYANDNNVDMIVMGRRGLGAIGAMLGSVSYSVLHQMSIPVVTVK